MFVQLFPIRNDWMNTFTIMQTNQILTATEITISYRPPQNLYERPTIRKTEDAMQQFLMVFDRDLIALHEEFIVLYLNQANRVLGVYKASKGGITGTVADLRIILSVGLKILATAMILAHNHPSGNLRPSSADEQLTSKIKQAAALIDIKIIDHLIINPSEEYFSFADEGML